MCGIVAVARKNEPVNEEALCKAIGALHHRGPDGHKTWLSPNRQVGLAHTRLSIIDLVTGDQPLSNEDGRIHAVVNGELYDFQKIRSELENGGHFFKTRSDSEILVHLYEDLGVQCLKHLRGEFAFVLWDDSQRNLFAARDRFGIKPLFYAFKGPDLYLASEVKALVAAGIDLKWDRESFYHSNFLGTPLQHRTFFEGVYQVPAGHMIIWREGHFRLLKYWDFDYQKPADIERNSRDSQSMIEEFREVLDEAVRLRLHADVPVACYLSGGLDSCAVLGLAAKHASLPVQAFTLGFDHEAYDETHIAREMAKKAGAVFNPIAITQDELADNFEDAVWNAETLLNNAHGVAKFVLSRAVRDAGYKVVLTGEGSDEILAGYPHFRRDKIMHASHGETPEVRAKWLNQLREANRVSSMILMPTGDDFAAPLIEKTIGFFPSWMVAYGLGGKFYETLYKDEYAACTSKMSVHQALSDSLDIAGQIEGRDAITKSMYLWSKVILPNYILSVLGDRMEMAHSIEGRVPFLDHHVVEMARRLPSSLKISGMTEKFVLREATKNVITDEVYIRQKHPFLSPPAALKKEGRLSQMLHDNVLSSAFRDQPFFDQKRVSSLLDNLADADDFAKSATDVILTAILSTTVLQQKFGLS